MKQSRLPEERKILSMVLGERGYTVPWAMFACDEGFLFINEKYAAHAEPRGTAHMLIERTKGGVQVFRETIGDNTYPKGGAPDWLETALPVALV
jgi:hypothetical protein